jgi:hypothetical protein
MSALMSCYGVKAGVTAKQDVTHLSRVRPAIAQQNAEASSQGRAAGGSLPGDAIE